MPASANPSNAAVQRVPITAPPLSDADRTIIQSIKTLEEAARASVSDLNNLPKIMQHATSSIGDASGASPRVLVAAVQALCRCVSSSMESGLLSSSSTASSSSSSETVRSWLRNLHSNLCKVLLSSLSSPLPFVQASALRCIIGLSAREAETGFDKDSLSGGLFPRCIAQLVDNAHLADTTIQVLLQEYVQVYDDVRCHTLNAITTAINELVINHTRPCSSTATSVVDHAVTMLLVIAPAAADAAPSCLAAAKNKGGKQETVKIEKKKRKRSDGDDDGKEIGPIVAESEFGTGSQKKAFGRAWLAVLRCDMTPATYKKILKAVATHVVPHLNQPLLLADFFTRSYDVGGVVSILALNGLFFLIHKHNLDYPQFYMKLYRLFEPSVLLVRYRARFFSLADLFLRSSMLPAYLAAAFIKRLARLALTAPTPGVCVCASFIFNLLRRHPSCSCLLHRGSISSQPADIANAPKDLVKAHTGSSGDPFDDSVADPALANAMSSSLWELQLLKQHANPDVARLMEAFDTPITRALPEHNLDELLQVTYHSVACKELQRRSKVEIPPLAYARPPGLFGPAVQDASVVA